MDEYVWLDRPLHKNNIKYDFMSDDDVVSSLKISFDGAIMAVKRSLVETHYADQEVKLIRLGYKDPPKNIKVENSDNLYKLLSFYVDL